MKRALILLAVLTVIALALGGLVLASANSGVKTITAAVDAVSAALGAEGAEAYSPEIRSLIDAADAAIAAQDPNLHLTDRVENLDALRQAKIAYAEGAIKALHLYARPERVNGSEKVVDEARARELLAAAEEAFARYFTEADAADIRNYQQLVTYREKYAEKAPAAPVYQQLPNPDPSDPIELC